MKITNPLLFAYSLFIGSAYATPGPLFELAESGSPTSADIILCLNGKGPVSCQRYHVSAQNLTIRTTIKRNYPLVGIKILTPGFSPTGCTPFSNGYCLFATTANAGTSITVNASSQELSAPNEPTAVIASKGNAAATVSWTAPANNGGSPILSYTVTEVNGGNSCTVAAPATQCVVGGLTNGTAYTFSVTATNAVGTSIASAPSNAVTPLQLEVLASFNSTTGYYIPTATPGFPWGGLTQGSDGSLYGVAPAGGTQGGGTIFKLSLIDNSLTVLANFNASTPGAPSTPYGKLLQASNGDFYGTTLLGGANGYGTVFKFSPTNPTVTVLANFDTGASNAGINPVGGLIQPIAGGDLYGFTYQDGTNGYGNLYKISLDGSVFNTLGGLTSVTGTNVVSNPFYAADGNLYAATLFAGGLNGSVITSSLAGNPINKVASFSLQTGFSGASGLLQASDGYLYGVTAVGASGTSGGGVYKVLPGSSTLTRVVTLDSTSGELSVSTLIQDNEGYLYGTGSSGGTSGGGTIYKVDPAAGTATAIVSFNAATGTKPYGGLLLASNGYLYGMTTLNGPTGATGTLYVVYPPFS